MIDRTNVRLHPVNRLDGYLPLRPVLARCQIVSQHVLNDLLHIEALGDLYQGDVEQFEEVLRSSCIASVVAMGNAEEAAEMNAWDDAPSSSSVPMQERYAVGVLLAEVIRTRRRRRIADINTIVVDETHDWQGVAAWMIARLKEDQVRKHWDLLHTSIPVGDDAQRTFFHQQGFSTRSIGCKFCNMVFRRPGECVTS
jgi:hypothetical protein